MAVNVITPKVALQRLHCQFGETAPDVNGIPSNFYFRLVRRICSTNCPMPRGKLVRQVIEHLRELVEDEDLVQKSVELALLGLFEAGDLMEISKFRSLDETYSGDWIFTAPPSYVKRNNGLVHIFGIAEDDAPILPLTLQDKIQHRGPFRFFQSIDDESIKLLESFGLRDVPEVLWSIRPHRENYISYLEKAAYKLAAASPSGSMDSVRICVKNTFSQVNYRDRWKYPKDETGSFIARRPREYGAESWCYAELLDGKVTKFVDLPWPSEHFRGCDSAWRLQLAIDAASGHPATYTTSEEGENIVVKFSFPIPLWASHRFRLAGNSDEMHNWQYAFTARDWPIEKEIIENDLWFVPALLGVIKEK